MEKDIQINRRNFLKNTATIGAGFSLLGAGCTVNAFDGNTTGNNAKKPNILFIPVDDLRIQLGCYGHTETISPASNRE